MATKATMIHNFNAGPSILPKQVIEAAAQAVVNFNNSGLSILEIGHRTEAFESVMSEARALVKELMQLGEDHEPLFLHGGATTQFMQIPMNLLNENGSAAYTETGTWSSKAIKESKNFGEIYLAGSTKEDNYRSMPDELDIKPNTTYLHITTNETIAGTQWKAMPFQYNVPVVADMSSDIFSRNLPFNQFALIYAGAQKNMGAAGVNLVVVNKNILGNSGRNIPSIMDYRNHIAEKSMLNTPPVFAVYVAMLTLRWIKENGGIAAMEQLNNKKSDLVYDTIDAISLYHPVVKKQYRSDMNIVFTIADKTVEEEFLQLCKANGMYGIKGHRSVGGFRISLYNALPYESVEAVTDLMKHFANTKG